MSYAYDGKFVILSFGRRGLFGIGAMPLPRAHLQRVGLDFSVVGSTSEKDFAILLA